MNFKKIRQAQRKTQREVAEYLNVNQNSYSNYENEKANPSLDMLIKLADYFKVTVDALLGHEVPYLLDKSLLSSEQELLVDKVSLLNDEQCKRVSSYIDGILD